MRGQGRMAQNTHLDVEGLQTTELDAKRPRAAVRNKWAGRVQARLLISDLIISFLACIASQAITLPAVSLDVAGPRSAPQPPYWLVSLGIAVGWTLLLGLNGSRDRRILGSGAEEYRRVVAAVVWMLGGLGLLAYGFQYQVARSYVLLALPLALIALISSRWAWRAQLMRARSAGKAASRILTVEGPNDAGRLAEHVFGAPSGGLKVVGQLTVTDRVTLPQDVARLASKLEIDAVAVSASAHLEPAELSQLMWALEEVGADLILAPSVHGIAGPRVHTRPVEGLPLLYIDGPRYTGAMRTVKDLFDKACSAVALLLLSPIFAVIALGVKTTSRGPVFYRQTRVGLNGDAFTIWKFRSMAHGADAELLKLVREDGSFPPLIKPMNDMRVTRLGYFLRKWSLDELPQLFNVLTGTMSLVGPRPQRPQEVMSYTAAHARRLKTKPGMTGLWQVSGRNDLEWDDAVMMDLYYVENWSLSLDMVLIWRTIFAVLRGRGAY